MAHRLYLKIKIIFVTDLMAFKMKKFVVIVAFALLAALALGSCSHEVCPAYRSSAADIPENVG